MRQDDENSHLTRRTLFFAVRGGQNGGFAVIGESAAPQPQQQFEDYVGTMIKPDDIKKHTAEFFTSDPDFVLWCLDPERAQDGYWCGYTERHPQDLVEFERAVSLVRRVGKTHPALPSVEKQLLLDRILTDHYARRRFAAPPRRRNRTALFAAASLLVAGVVAPCSGVRISRVPGCLRPRPMRTSRS